jgi:hypothetical protein
MENWLRLLTNYGAGLAAVGAAITFVWSLFQFFSVRRREAKVREFETFHKLIKELVEPPTDGASLYLDRQCAILFELRFFPRYYPFTRRTLLGLRAKWSVSAAHLPRLLEELEITLNVIDRRLNTRFMRTARKLRLLPGPEP